MGMPKGLVKATAFYNRISAQADWQKLAAEMTAIGFADLVAECQPPEGASWRKIDKASARLKAAVAARQKAEQA
jgi:hypothetical protein